MGSFSVWHWLILGAIVLWIWLTFFRKPQRSPATPPAARGGATIAKIRGNGKFDTEVVGESHYAESFEALFRAHRVDDREDEWTGDAVLKLEANNPHDRNAVAVYLEGRQVGYLSRDMAQDFRHALLRDGLTGRDEYAVAARVYWGGEDRHHSVSLDLPQD
jgi:hypothetical protein